MKTIKIGWCGLTLETWVCSCVSVEKERQIGRDWGLAIARFFVVSIIAVKKEWRWPGYLCTHLQYEYDCT